MKEFFLYLSTVRSDSIQKAYDVELAGEMHADVSCCCAFTIR